MSWYDDIASAKVGTSGPRFEPGNYKVALEYFKENKSDAGHYFISVFTILESDNPNLKAGLAEVGYAIRLDAKFENHRKNSLAEVKACLAALLGMPASSSEAMAIDGRVLGQALQRPSPLRGLVTHMTCWLKQPGEKSAPGTKPFTKATFRPVTPGQVTKVQMTADAGPAPVVVTPAPGPTASPATSIATAVQSVLAAPSAAPPISMPSIAMPPAALPFPPPGWAEHPQHPGYYYNPAKGNWFPQRAELEQAQRDGKA
jgi:hypothetical protein